MVVAADLAAFSAKYPTVTNVIGGWTGQLSNRTETIELRDSLGQAVDNVTYFDEGDWARRELGPLDLNHRGWVWSDAADGGGSSLELVSTSLSNNFGQNWSASLTVNGTPGAANSTADADSNVAPLIVNATHFPIIPRSTDPVTISARLVDELSVGLSAALFWRVDGAASFTQVAMLDNGTGGDVTSGDQVFSAQLPAMASGTVVEFYIRSQDQVGNQRTYPTPTQPSGQQLTNLLYQVDNSFTGVLPGPTDKPVYRLIMTEAERAELAQIGTISAESESGARMNGTFIALTSDGAERRYQVGIRNRGVGSADAKPNSYHVDLPRDATWRGLEALNFNTQFTNAQMAGLKLAAAAGLVAEDSQIVSVRVNGADLAAAYPGVPAYGVYMYLEASDNVFVTNHFPEDDAGNLYRIIRDAAGHGFGDFRDLGATAADFAPFYDKKTNTSEADFSDIMELVNVLNHATDGEYIAKLQQIADIDEWLTYFATMAILGTEETSLATGIGDDFMVYRGANDPRFMLLPHDFDSILGQGAGSPSPTKSIYRAEGAAAIQRFLQRAEIRPLYHQKLKDLLNTSFAKTSVDAILDQYLTSFTPAATIAAMKTFMDSRRTYIMGLVNGSLTATTTLTVQNGFPRTTSNSVILSGVAPLAGTKSVVARGVVATYNYASTTGTWSLPAAPAGATPLRPGINRIDVRAYDGPNGTGNVLASTFIDIWYDDGSVVNAGGTINTNTFWSAAGGPYVVTSDLTVTGPVTLTIEAGASVFFNAGTGLTISSGARLLAEGTADAHIRFTRNPASTNTSWDGMVFSNASPESRLIYADVQAGAGSGNAVRVDHARLTIDHVNWFNIIDPILDLIHPILSVSNSVFPAVSSDETVHLIGIDFNESLSFENNIFGVNSSGSDVVDIGHSTLTPPTIIFRGNTFLGGGDDGIDTDGFPVIIENNSFQNFHKTSSGGTTSNAVSTGHATVSGQTVSSNLTLRNNTFINNDHHLLLKDFSFATAINNTFVGATIAAIHFTEPTGNNVIGPGLGANLDGNIFWNNVATLIGQTGSTQLMLNRSVVPAAFVGLGVGNLAVDPMLVNPTGGNFSLKRGSLALGAGPNGSDIGAVQTPRNAKPTAANLRITEIHYHPFDGNKPIGEVGGDGDEFEFLEIQNISGETVDLTDVALNDGVDFTFPWLSSLASGATAVLAGNRDLFLSRYGASVPVAGEYSGSLSNSGERVRLIDGAGAILAEVTYGDGAPWPASADGSGPSLELNGPHVDATAAASWHASVPFGGTPGFAFSLVINPADFDNDADVDGADFLAWQRGLGKTSPNGHIADGDADHDKDVDAADLTIYRSQFGAMTAVAAVDAALAPAEAAAVMAPIDFSQKRQLGADAADAVDAAIAVDACNADRATHRKLAAIELLPRGDAQKTAGSSDQSAARTVPSTSSASTSARRRSDLFAAEREVHRALRRDVFRRARDEAFAAL